MASEINRGDIISTGALSEGYEYAKGLDAATMSLEKLIGISKQLGGNIKAADTITKVNDETNKLTLAQKELVKVESQIKIAIARNTIEYQNQKKEVSDLNKEAKIKSELGKRDTKTITENNASINQLISALNANRLAYKNLSAEQRNNTKEGKDLKAIIDQQDVSVKKLNGGLGDFRDNVGNYAGAMKGLKLELKSAKDEMAFLAKNTGTTSPEFVKAAAKAGDLKDQINDLNDQIKITSGNKFETLGASLKDVGSKLLNLDFEGAANSAKQFAAVIKSLTFAEIAAGIQSFGATLATVGKALLTNPIFYIAATIAGVALAFKYFYDQQAAATERTIERYKKEEDAMVSRYDKEIKIQKILGKQTFDLEKERQRVISDTAQKELQILFDKDKAFAYSRKSGFTEEQAVRLYLSKADKERYNELKKIQREAANETEIINAEQAKFEKETSESILNKKKEDLFALNKFRLETEAAGQKDIIDNDKESYGNRLSALVNFQKLKDDISRLENKNSLDHENLTATEILLINEKLQSDITANIKEAGNIRSGLRDVEQEKLDAQLKGIQDRLAKAGKKIGEGMSPPKDITQEWAEAGVVIGMTFQHVSDTAQFKFEEMINNSVTGLENLKQKFIFYANLVGGLLDSLTERRIQKIDQEEKALDESTQRQIKAAGDNESAKQRIEDDAEKKRVILEKKRLKEKQKSAKFDKAVAITIAAINAAQAVLVQIGGGDPYSAFARAALAAAIGAVQLATIIAKPIPQYFKGAAPGEHKGGAAMVGERGTELMRAPGGDWQLTPSTATVMDLKPGTEVIPHDETMRRLALGGLGRSHSHESVQDERAINELQNITKAVKSNRPVEVSYVRMGGVVYEAKKYNETFTKIHKSNNLRKS